MSTDVDEGWRKGEKPVAYARRVARAKAESAAKNVDAALVLAADTTVWTHEDAEPLGKPADRDEARRMLTLLTRGREHFVTTAYVLLDTEAPGDADVAHETTRVLMRRLNADQVERYLDTGEWQDKAGGYAIQGPGALVIEGVLGCYYNVVGLPLFALERLFNRFDRSLLADPALRRPPPTGA